MDVPTITSQLTEVDRRPLVAVVALRAPRLRFCQKNTEHQLAAATERAWLEFSLACLRPLLQDVRCGATQRHMKKKIKNDNE